MYIDTLGLLQYRNYEKADIKFSHGINILYGDNAQGKTNVLEAIYMLATTKSHRGNRDKEIIGFNYEEAHIRADIIKNDMSRRVDMHLRKNKSKGVAIDQIPIKKSAELLGLMNVILFSPEDLMIIKESPAERRRFIDMELCQLSRIYYNYLSQYNKVLNQRNNLLKQISFDRQMVDMLSVWNDQLIDYGNKVILEREKFISMLNVIIKDIHEKLTVGKEKLTLIYDKNIHEDEFGDELLRKQDMDIRYQSTQVGPHRDDIIFMVNDIDVKKYGSQGQQRTVALSLKLAEIELVKQIIHDNPILLLDDVMSELDANRRDALLESISDIQTIITCTGYDDFIKKRLPVDRIYKVTAGEICEEVSL